MNESAKLRRLAQEQLKAKSAAASLPGTEGDLRRLVHELQVHQVELEIQNETLCQAKAALEESTTRYTDLYDFAPIGYFTLARNGAVRAANLRGASLLGVERSRLVGRRFGLFVAPEAHSTFADFLEAVFAQKSPDVCEFPLAAGTRYVRVEAALSESGDECRAAITDITDHKRLEEELRRSEERLQLATASGQLGVWDWDVQADVLHWNDRMYELYGIPREDSVECMEAWERAVHPDDLAGAFEAFRAAVRGDRASYNTEFRIVRPDGTVRHLKAEGMVIRDARGKPLRMLGLNRDVTDARRFEAAAEFLATCGASEPKDGFFPDLARFLGQHLGMDYVCIDRLEEGNLAARTVAVHCDGELQDNVSYTLKDTPCGDVLERGVCSFPKGVRHLFPEDRVLQDLEAESYFGITLFRHDGSPIGLIALIGRRAEERPKAVESVLRLAAIRAAAELERTEAEDALERARDVAQAADRAKSTFLANMSHEIRTPLSGVIGMLRLLRASPLDEDQRSRVEQASASAAHLLLLIDDILDFSKIEAGMLKIEAVALSPAFVAGDAVRGLMPEASAKGIGLSFRMDAGVPELVVGDPHRLRQVLMNLIGNAVKFTHEGEVTVTVGVDPAGPTKLLFAVRDTGIGISAEGRARLFKSFSQVDDSTARTFGGTGLGLAISKELVERMGGSIGVRSEEGKGCTFTFSLPFAPAPEGSAAALAPGEEKAALVPEKLRVLVAEDEPVNRAVTVAYLQARGWRVTAVADGRAAVETFHSEPFDVVLMDVGMPEVDGFEATRLIREGERSSGVRVPIIGLTAHALRRDRERCLEAGMNGHLAKPADPETLYAAIERWVSARPQPPKGSSPGAGKTARDWLLSGRSGGDGATGERVSQLLAGLDEGLGHLREALSKGDPGQVAFWAHRLRGTLVVFGFSDAADAALEIESQTVQLGLDGAGALVERLEREIDWVRRSLAGDPDA